MTQDIILEATMEFIRSDEKNLKLALQVEKAMPQLRRELCRQVLEATERKLKEADPADWEICSSYGNDQRDLMKRYAYLALRKNGWKGETQWKEYPSGVQLITDKECWQQVWLGIVFPKCFAQDPGIKHETLKSFRASQLERLGRLYGGGGDENQMWRYCRFANWTQEKFMLTALNDQDRDEFAGELANGLMCLAQLVEDNLS